MDNNTPKINIVPKGIKPPVSPEERKYVDSDTMEFHQEYKPVYKIDGTEIILKDQFCDNIGTMYLWEDDPVNDDSVKVKQIMVDQNYQGSGAVHYLYGKALEIATQKQKNLVLDCKAGVSAFKSFEKFAHERNLPIIKNEENIFNKEMNRWEAPNETWTLKILL